MILICIYLYTVTLHNIWQDSEKQADQETEKGDRDIYKKYISFRCYRGKVVPGMERRWKSFLYTLDYMLSEP